MRCLLFFLIAQCFLVNTVVASTQGSYRSEQWEVANSDTIENGQRVVTIGLPQISVKAMVQDKSGLMWIGTENGLARFDGRHFEIFNTINAPNLPSNWVTQLYSDDNEKVWVLTADGVAIFDGNTFSPLTGNKNTYTSIAQTRNGDIWLAGNGLWHYHDGSLSKARFATDDVISVNAHGDNLWLLERTNQLVRVNLQAEQSGSQQCRFQLPDDIRIENTVVTASQVFSSLQTGYMRFNMQTIIANYVMLRITLLKIYSVYLMLIRTEYLRLILMADSFALLNLQK